MKKQPPAFSIDQALLAIALTFCRQHGGVNLPLSKALGKTCALDCIAPHDQPRFNSAAMDGWAVRGPKQIYRIVGESRAGSPYLGTLQTGEAIAISTGAMVPSEATALARREQAWLEHKFLRLAEYRPGRDIRAKGCDFGKGAVLTKVGQTIDHLDIARLAAAGFANVSVRQEPRVSLLATGDEIVPGGEQASPYQNYDSLSPSILARLGSFGFEVNHMGVARDCDEAILAPFELSDAEVMIVIGGASGGRHDRVRHALRAKGLTVVVPAVAMRPGKPFWCGVLADGRAVFGLPGNPVAALISLELFVLPALWALMGRPPQTNWIAIGGDCSDAPISHEKVCFARHRQSSLGVFEIDTLGLSDSAALMPLVAANAIVRSGGGYPFPRVVPLTRMGWLDLRQ